MFSFMRSVHHRYSMGLAVRIQSRMLRFWSGKSGEIVKLTRSNAEMYPSYMVRVTHEGRDIGLVGPLYEEEIIAVGITLRS